MEYRFDPFNGQDKKAQIPTIAELNPCSDYYGRRKPAGERLNCAFSPDDTLFAWSCGIRDVILIPWNPTNNCINQQKSLRENDINFTTSDFTQDYITIDCKFLVTSLTFAGGLGPDGQPSVRENFSRFDFSKDLMLAVGHDNGRIRVWDPYTGKLLLELTDHRYRVNSMSVCVDGTLRLASGSDDGTIKVWDLLDGGNLCKTMSDHKRSPVLDLCWSPDSKTLCAVGRKQKVLLCNMDEYMLEKRLSGHCHDVVSCSFSPDGALVATASLDTKVIIWDSETGLPLRQLAHLVPLPGLIYMSGSNNHQVTFVRFAPNGLQVVSTCIDGNLRFWDLTDDSDEAETYLSFPEDDPITSCAYSSSGAAVSVSHTSGKVSIYGAPTKLPSLLHCSRMAVRKNLGPTANLAIRQDCLIPRTLVPFLQYKEW